VAAEAAALLMAAAAAPLKVASRQNKNTTQIQKSHKTIVFEKCLIKSFQNPLVART
jgi:hypothetical protein